MGAVGSQFLGKGARRNEQGREKKEVKIHKERKGDREERRSYLVGIR